MAELCSQQIGRGESRQSTMSTVRASKCRSRKIDIGTSTSIGSAHSQQQHAGLFGPHLTDDTEKIRTSDELDRLVRV